MKRNFLLAALGLLVVAATFFPLFRYTDSRRFQEDEHIFVRRGIFLDYYLAGKFFDPIWQSFDSYDVPKFGEFFYGVVIRLYSNRSVETYLNSRPKFLSSDANFQNPWYIEYSRNSCCSIQDLPTEIQERIQPILVARKVGVFFALFSLLALLAIGWRTKSWVFGVLIVLILGNNHLFKDTMTTAMGDGPLIFFSLCYAISVGLFVKNLKVGHKKKYLRYFVIAAVSAGLATATKLNGVINIIHFGLIAFLFLNLMRNPFRLIKFQFAFIGIAYLTFFVLNPFLWTNPLKNTVFMKGAREATIAHQQDFSDKHDQSLYTIPQRISRTYERTVASNSYYGNFNLNQTNSIGLTLFLCGLLVSFTKMRRMKANSIFTSRHREQISFGLWVTAWISITTLLIPLDWDHYYLPIVLGISVLQSYTISEILEKLFACFSSSGKIVPDQK